MNIGFIGAGKVGCTLGKYFAEGGLKVKGYYSTPVETAQQAAHFTDTLWYETAEALIKECDMVFITVPDGVISEVWNTIRSYNIKDKIVCHCSGAMSSSEAFSGIEETGALGYSVHPLFAVSDKFDTYREMTGVFFTIEGASQKIDIIARMLDGLGNEVRIIDKKDKTLYHCAAAAASNLVCAVFDMSFELMSECGFSDEDARHAMASLIRGNVEHVIEEGAKDALTGPVERCDIETIKKHLKALEAAGASEEEEIYKVLSRRLAAIASRRHPNRDYAGMYQLLEKGK